MRKLIAAASFTLVLGVAGAAGTEDDAAPEGRAYLGFSFGGERPAPRDFHYGLRLDHDRRLVDGAYTPPPVMQFDFTSRGLNDARVNGLSIVSQKYRLRQNEEETEEGAEPVEEEGFFEGMWSGVTGFFGGLFGGDDEEEVAEAADETVEEAPEELAEGTFMGYRATDWALLAIGAVGIGYIGSEVANSDDDPDAGQGGADGGGDGGDDDGGGGDLPDCIPDTELCNPLYTGRTRGLGDRADPEYQEWLDGGTGQMGDLGG